MASIFDWSTTAANNATADAAINWAEGQDPNTVNNSARQMMGRNAEFLADIGGALTAGGTANALTVTANSAFTTLANGRLLAFTAASDNTTAATLNVNGIGAKSIRKMTTASGDAALAGAEIQAGGIYLVQYSTAANAAAGGWILVNPTIADLATFATLTGAETLTNKVLTAPTITTSLLPTTDDGAALGSTTKEWSDLFLATGGVINWANGNYTITHATGSLSLSAKVWMANGSQANPIIGCAANTDMGIYFPGAAAIAFGVDNVEIFRTVTNAVNVGKTAADLVNPGSTFQTDGLWQSTRSAAVVAQLNRLTSDGTVEEFMTSGTVRGSVSIAGATTSYNTSSDERLKENPRSFDAGEIIDRLNVYQFDWKEGGSGYGVFAQEAYEVFPDAILKGDEERIWQADYAKFVPLLLKEVQNLRKKLKG